MNTLELSGIFKSFGPVHALRGADFVLAQGEVHGLLGENGAGKSTLMHIAYGLTQPDSGTIRRLGREVVIRTPRDARRLGMGMVHQHFTSIGALTVEENLVLARGPRAEGEGKWTTGRMGRRLMEGLKLTARVQSLSVGLRQRLEIVKALATDASILLLDEPSAVLAPQEVEELLQLVGEFVDEGGSAVLITHKLAEVLAVADRVTVLRHGVVTLHGAVKEHTEQSLALAMIGQAPAGGRGPVARRSHRRTPPAPAGDRRPRTPAVHLGGLPVYPGELMGIAAVEGNGQRELLRAIATGSGVAGTVAFVPEDRTTEGVIPEFSVTENVVLGLGEDPRWVHGMWLDWRAAGTRTAELIEGFGIRTHGPDARLGTLSGGNQQKVVLARALERRPDVLVAENPTRGLDFRATAEMHERLRAAADEGMAVLVYSTDLDEVMELADRVLVVASGRVLEAPADANRRMVGEMMLGVDGREPSSNRSRA